MKSQSTSHPTKQKTYSGRQRQLSWFYTETFFLHALSSACDLIQKLPKIILIHANKGP